MEKLELRTPPVAVTLIVALAMWAAARWLAVGGLGFVGPVWLAAALATAGFAAAVAGVRALRGARTTVDPRDPDKTARLVTSGIFRHTRNPMYLGMLLALVGWGVYLAHAAALICVAVYAAYMTVFQIVPEERAMQRKFGDAYEAYTQRVRRWL